MLADLFAGLQLEDEFVGEGLVLVELGGLFKRDQYEGDHKNAEKSGEGRCKAAEV